MYLTFLASCTIGQVLPLHVAHVLTHILAVFTFLPCLHFCLFKIKFLKMRRIKKAIIREFRNNARKEVFQNSLTTTKYFLK